MHSMTFFVIFLFLAIAVISVVYILVRVVGARAVDSDHTADPDAPRPDDFGDADRRLAVLTREVGDAAGGWLACECGVCPVMVVDVQPLRQGLAA